MAIKYVGRFKAVSVPALGGRVVNQGEAVENIEPEVRDALLNTGNWAKVENGSEGDEKPSADPTPTDKPEGAPSADSVAPAATPAPAKDVREWAKANGIDVPARGAISDDVRAKYDAAHAPGKGDAQ